MMATSSDASANLVVNGGFEEPAFNGEWTIFDSVPGWHWDGDYPIEILRDLNNFKGWVPYEGRQYMEATSIEDLYQYVPTMPGYHYVLSYAYSPRPSTELSPVVDNPLDVYWNGQLVASHNTLSTGVTYNQWTVYSYEVIASSSSTLLQFKSQRLGVGTFLDDIRLEETATQPVPEPSAVAGVLSLLIAAIAVRSLMWRRQMVERGVPSC
ncbi:MAG: hypothetical protein WEB58_18285 [Planctomycetaceae bacterium]